VLTYFNEAILRKAVPLGQRLIITHFIHLIVARHEIFDPAALTLFFRNQNNKTEIGDQTQISSI
jgi:hypothetical protein